MTAGHCEERTRDAAIHCKKAGENVAKRKRKKRKKKRMDGKINVRDIIIRQRAGIRPGQWHKDNKKEADKKACRKENTTDGSD
ncbi:hypothetical protein L6259_00615 [Candidatus Parcubacteria bacterium]|nr:hypothetical protein [Patescibacteria group bacterium]MCG2693775.1 hypothetical protein [Candidatus Parcubacteria bacterium]